MAEERRSRKAGVWGLWTQQRRKSVNQEMSLQSKREKQLENED